jgi:hypothetical protein
MKGFEYSIAAILTAILLVTALDLFIFLQEFPLAK